MLGDKRKKNVGGFRVSIHRLNLSVEHVTEPQSIYIYVHVNRLELSYSLWLRRSTMP